MAPGMRVGFLVCMVIAMFLWAVVYHKKLPIIDSALVSATRDEMQGKSKVREPLNTTDTVQFGPSNSWITTSVPIVSSSQPQPIQTTGVSPPPMPSVPPVVAQGDHRSFEQREYRCMGREGPYCIDTEGAWRYNPRGDRVFRLTPAGIRRCLAGKTIVITGDSRMRYMTLAMTYMLSRGTFLKCRDYASVGVGGEPDECIFVFERKSTSWNDFYRTTNRLLNGFSNGSELCDCYRHSVFTAATTRENRFFTLNTPWGTIRIMYFQMFEGTMTLRHDFPPFAPEGTAPRCSPGNCSTADEQHNGETGLRLLLRRMNVTHLYSSLGWYDNFDGSCLFRQLSKEFPRVEIFGVQSPMFTPETIGNCSFRRLALRALTLDMPASLHWDSLHYWSIGNEEMVHALVSTVCNSAMAMDVTVTN